MTVPGGWAVGVIQAKREGKGKQGKGGAIAVGPEGGNEHELVLWTLESSRPKQGGVRGQAPGASGFRSHRAWEARY